MIAMQAQKVLKRLGEYGYQAYAVGGCVRDFLMQQTPHDWDIATSATPYETMACFQDYHVIETGIKHGTVTIMIDHIPIEVTTFRSDGDYSDGRHPDKVSFVTSLEDDLMRRDFTINAMAMDANGQIIDLYHGKQDLLAKKIRCVGDAPMRFHEDALRIMRALRFASVLDFSIEANTAAAIHALKENLSLVSKERIASELARLLMGDAVFAMLRDFPDVLSQIIPEMKPLIGFNQHSAYHIYDIYLHTAHAVASSAKQLPIRLAMLLHDIGKPECFHRDANGIGHFYGHAHISCQMAKEILKRFKFDNHTIDTVCLLILHHDGRIAPKKASIKRCLRLLGTETFEMLLYVQLADDLAKASAKADSALAHYQQVYALYEEVLAASECFSLSDLAVNGHDLYTLGLRDKAIGDMLQLLLDEVITEKTKNTRESLLQRVSKAFDDA